LQRRDEGGRIALSARQESSWFSPAALQLVHEVNRQLLEVLSEEGPASNPSLPLAGELRDVLCAMSPMTRQRVARCPLLLLDAGFSDVGRWSSAAAEILESSDLLLYDGDRPDGAAIRLAHITFICAWSIARGDPNAARLMLGMSLRCASVISNLSLQGLRQIADRYWFWIVPRRADRPDVWRRLLAMSAENLESPIADPGLRAWQLFLGD
jgi:hypothetical protein